MVARDLYVGEKAPKVVSMRANLKLQTKICSRRPFVDCNKDYVESDGFLGSGDDISDFEYGGFSKSIYVGSAIVAVADIRSISSGGSWSEYRYS